MNAIQSLVVAANLLGVDASAPQQPVQPTPLFSVALADVVARQNAACRPMYQFDVCLAFGTGYETWFKFKRAGGATVAFSESQLREGRELEGLRLSYAEGALTVGERKAPIAELLTAVYKGAERVRLGALVDYAVLWEDGALVAKSATFLRQDQNDGTFYLAWRPAARLASHEWLLAVNGIMYGPRLEGDVFRFYSKPVPIIPKPSQTGVGFGEERRIPIR